MVPEGLGTALKPAVEFWFVARKPIVGNVADNVLTHGTGGLNVDGCRVGTSKEGDPNRFVGCKNSTRTYAQDQWTQEKFLGQAIDPNQGRWPTNLVLSHSPGCVRRGTKRVKGSHQNGKPWPRNIVNGHIYEKGWKPGHECNGHVDPDGLETVADWDCAPGCPIRLIGEQSGESSPGKPHVLRRNAKSTGWSGGSYPTENAGLDRGDSGTAARFFPQFDADPFIYQAKASRADRNAGCEGMEAKKSSKLNDGLRSCVGHPNPNAVGTTSSEDRKAANHHPTVKSTPLMQWLCRLATPPGGLILDPFAGSGSTGVAAIREGFGFVGIESDPAYFAIARRRIKAAKVHQYTSA